MTGRAPSVPAGARVVEQRKSEIEPGLTIIKVSPSSADYL
jgi:hypothetical protein